MPLTLHSHSGQFCCHAKGELADVVTAAQAKGFRVLGLSEHVPRFRLQDLYDEERHLSVADLGDTFERYVATARALQRQHRSASFDLLVGAETEYINDESLVWAHQLRERHGLDYLVGSVHHVREIPIDFDQAQFNRCLAACGGSLIDLYADYFDAQYRMLTALRPEVVGHFDLCRLFTPRSNPLCRTLPPSVWERVLRNIDVVVAYGGLFEINSRAYKKGLPDAYPQRDILQV
ncbi:hypothetical protein IWQ60_002209 [Tieghemiomyces parasiticus]|uniref:Histidinol-phosphatase n=1 Tax=Tieghemiomyces parasiticus TaxID=78921 RepID=A0A9W8AD46_9FUNG|nr:hypothetical protein IWQ60_002209 [Tieghemiomyces parasiticus]